MRSTRNRKRGQGRKAVKSRANRAQQNIISYTLPKSLTIMPDRLVTNLRYLDTTNNILNNVGFTYASRRYRPTALQDVDPALGGTVVVGFTELAAIYLYYRVIKSKILVQFSNEEAFPVVVYLWPTNQDPGANYNVPDAAMTNPYTRKATLSAKGGQDRVTLSKSLSTKKFSGSPSAVNLDSYRSAVTTVPANNWFYNIGVWSFAPVLVNGIFTMTFVDMEVEFSERKLLVN